MKLFQILKINKKNFIYLLIVALALFLRLNNLSVVPPSASLDEASIGYNAYSILKTGADEYGNKLPILLRAYDDWRPALYVYLVIPFVKLLGLNVVSVRLPSVTLSVLTVIATYFLVKEIFKNKNLAILVSFLLAISPWHIYISRLGHEVNAGLAFVSFGLFFFIKALRYDTALYYSRKIILITLSTIFFAGSFYTYQSEKIFVPLILVSLSVIFIKELLKLKKEVLISIILGIIFIAPISLATFAPQALIRFQGTSAFKKENPKYKESADKVLKYKNEGNVLGQIVNNRRLVPFKIFATNYFSHFNPRFIFFNSGNESFKAPNFGLLYVWELPFLIIGIIYLLKAYDKKTKSLLIFWLLIAFIAPSLTTGAPHAMRAFNVLPVPQIFTALGIFWLINFIKANKISSYTLHFFYLAILIVIIYFLGNFYREYFYTFPKNQSSSFQYSLSKSIGYVIKNEKFYNKIIFSNKDNLYQSYMFYLFYSIYDPFLYQRQGGTKSGGFAQAHAFGKYEFRDVNLNKESSKDRNLHIINASETSGNLYILKTVQNLDGRDAIKILGNEGI